MKKNIAVLTATRAEYGLLKPVINSLLKELEFNVSLLVTGAHLSADFGYTYKEIEEDGIPIAVKIDILTNSDTNCGVSECMALAISKFAHYFETVEIDALIVLGDRYETLAVCCAAMNARIPIIHLHGGETTQGAIDEAIRHSITKMSYLHFTSNEVHRKRVVQLGENPDRVFNVGAIGVENALKMKLLSYEELEKAINFKLNNNFALVTFHPATLENISVKEQFFELEKALDKLGDINYIITKANADVGGRTINKMIDEFAMSHSNVVAFTSMGVLKYLSAMKYCSMVIGNSSSGIIEAPSFKVPTINIGDRQKGRMQATSIINCECNASDIINAMEYARSNEFAGVVQSTVNPYGDGNTSLKINSILKKVFGNGEILLSKEFYDIDFNI